MARRKLDGGLTRRKYIQEPKQRFVIFCEGEKTEPAYFAAIRSTCAHTLIEIKTRPAGEAFSCAEEAVKYASGKSRDSFEKNDQVWAVFDRDNAPRFEEALALCQKKGVRVGRSNPCFEVWLILHLQEFDQPCDPKGAQKYLEAIHAPYDPDRGKTPDCAELVKAVEEAEARAAAGLKNRDRDGKPFGSPSTTVHELTRAIREAAAKAKPRGRG